MILRAEDFVACGICVNGLRDQMKAAGVDFRHFVKHGMPEEEVATFPENAFVERALVKMRERGGE